MADEFVVGSVLTGMSKGIQDGLRFYLQKKESDQAMALKEKELALQEGGQKERTAFLQAQLGQQGALAREKLDTETSLRTRELDIKEKQIAENTTIAIKQLEMKHQEALEKAQSDKEKVEADRNFRMQLEKLRQSGIDARYNRSEDMRVKGASANAYKAYLAEAKPLLSSQREFSSVDNLLSQVKNSNSVADAALGIKLAKALGEVGVQTEKDVTRYKESGILPRQIADKFLMWTQGKRTDATVAEIRQVINAIKTAQEENIEEIKDRHVSSHSAIYGVDPTTVKARFGLTDTPKPVAPKTSVPTIQPSKPKIKIGTVDGGYRYEGGNPSDPKSWRKIK